jgi:hypothetical protein
MGRGNSLTISACSGRKLSLRAGTRRARGGLAAVACLLLGACTIEVGPPPESDPPLVPEAAKAPPPPPQPSGPQPWSRDLDFDSAPAATNRGELAEGLVAGDAQARYSGQRLTFESAFNPEKPPSEAELVRQRAQQRAAAAGMPAPPLVTAAPVTEVEAQSLPDPGGTAEAAAPRRESRLPPPPKFPPPSAEPPATQGAEAAPEAAEPAGQATATAAAEPAKPEPWAARQSRLPAPPKFPPLETAPAPVEAAATETVAPGDTAAPAETAAGEAALPAEETVAAAFIAEAWDPPTGTILVQVSAVPDGGKVTQEWERLRARYPQVLQPLRLVVDEAKLGERGVFYRVQAGAFGTQAGAVAACDSLISQGQACFVVVR